jgi:hypothetical protein
MEREGDKRPGKEKVLCSNAHLFFFYLQRRPHAGRDFGVHDDRPTVRGGRVGRGELDLEIKMKKGKVLMRAWVG